MTKPKVAFYWCASCGGCEEAVVDLGEHLLEVVGLVDIAFWPVALDFKRSHVESLEDGELAVSFINGAVRSSEQEEMAALLRRKSRLVIAFGTCAHLGGVPGLANTTDRAGILERAFRTAPTVVNEEGILPSTAFEVDAGGKNAATLRLPELFDEVLPLDRVIQVDYYLPGCAPPPDLVQAAVKAVLEGGLPERGSVLAPDKSLCSTCPRRDSKPDKLSLSRLHRVAEITPSRELCFLEQGLVCLGPATRTGCGERCIAANMTCRGCFGPTSGVRDQGGRFLSGLAALFETESEDEAAAVARDLIDPVGVLYMYGLPSSALRRVRKAQPRARAPRARAKER